MTIKRKKTRGRDTTKQPEKFEYSNWNERVLGILNTRGMTQTELAEKIHVTFCTVHRMLLEKPDIKLSTLYKIADALDVSADWLLSGDIIYDPRQEPDVPPTFGSIMDDLNEVIPDMDDEDKINMIEKIVAV